MPWRGRGGLVAALVLLATAAGVAAAYLLGGAGASPVARPSARAPASRSCDGAPGCGIDGSESCCALDAVPGATYRRAYDAHECTDARFEATVAAFGLERYEVTVGRFRRFLAAGAPAPEPGAGAHPRIRGSGWDPAWSAQYAREPREIVAALRCGPGATWTDAPEDDTRPINCVTWFEAFAFCAWDGGRLPTEAEWNLAAAGGDEQRVRPWSVGAAPIDRAFAVYGELAPARVGSCSPVGDARWGHADLVGNVWEWTLDSSSGDGLLPDEGVDPCSTAGLPLPCVDCARVEPDAARVLRGAGFGMPAIGMRVAIRRADEPGARFPVFGVRCARDGDPSPREPSVERGTPHDAPPPTTEREEPLAAPSSLRVGDAFPPYALRVLRGDARGDVRLESIAPMSVLDDVDPGHAATRLLVAYVCAWAPSAAVTAATLRTHRDALRARGIEPLLVLADGATRGLPADGIDLATFAREHDLTYGSAIDARGEAESACDRVFLVGGEPARVVRIDRGPDAAAAAVAAALAP